MSAAEHGSRIVCLVVVGTARSFIFLMCASHQGERSIAGQENLACSMKVLGTGRKHRTHQDSKSESEGNARQDSLDVGGLVGREQLKEAISDQRQAQQGSTGKPEQRPLIFCIDGMKHPFWKQGQACVPDRPTVPASPREDDAPQEQSKENTNITGTYRKLVVVYFP